MAGMNRRDVLAAALGLAGAGATRALPAQQTQQPGPLERTFEEAKPLNLKITDLKTFLVDAGNDENFVFVKLYTNQGITGLGEGTLSNKGEVVDAAIRAHKRYLVGKDPTEIERHWRGMFIGPRYRGGPGAHVGALRGRDRHVGHPGPGPRPADLAAPRGQGA